MDMRREKAFTLIEIMIVMAIIGAFAVGIALPRFVKSREKTEKNVCLANRDSLERAEQRYFLDKGEHSVVLQDLVDESYLAAMPECPSEGVYAWVSYPEADPNYQTALGCSIHGSLEERDEDEDEEKPGDIGDSCDDDHDCKAGLKCKKGKCKKIKLKPLKTQ